MLVNDFIINDKIRNCNIPPKNLIAFPHGALLNLTTNIDPPTRTISYWFDFLSNRDATIELKKLSEIDIDIIFFGNQIINKKDLVVPHPRFRERLFVLEPLNDIAPNFLDPITNKTINQLLINAQNSSN